MEACPEPGAISDTCDAVAAAAATTALVDGHAFAVLAPAAATAATVGVRWLASPVPVVAIAAIGSAATAAASGTYVSSALVEPRAASVHQRREHTSTTLRRGRGEFREASSPYLDYSFACDNTYGPRS